MSLAFTQNVERLIKLIREHHIQTFSYFLSLTTWNVINTLREKVWPSLSESAAKYYSNEGNTVIEEFSLKELSLAIKFLKKEVENKYVLISRLLLKTDGKVYYDDVLVLNTPQAIEEFKKESSELNSQILCDWLEVKINTVFTSKDPEKNYLDYCEEIAKYVEIFSRHHGAEFLDQTILSQTIANFENTSCPTFMAECSKLKQRIAKQQSNSKRNRNRWIISLVIMLTIFTVYLFGKNYV